MMIDCRVSAENLDFKANTQRILFLQSSPIPSQLAKLIGRHLRMCQRSQSLSSGLLALTWQAFQIQLYSVCQILATKDPMQKNVYIIPNNQPTTKQLEIS
ncbi:hypothetical protein FGO68_gene3023 [Halteria grandinella]|uniref:Uncharacterized protein n=1 Tax=Halteria grandinella TaxID=5974 RepID=A0A8J8T7B1_HALGN|nr:hypothetical protein FGO68_gene3023 [Halteria grandinella]